MVGGFVGMGTALVCVLAVVIVSSLPLAEAQEGHRQVPATAVFTIASSTLLEIVIDAPYPESHATTFRARMDLDRDNFVNATEVENAETAFAETIRRHGLALGPPGGRVTINNGTPTTVLTKEVQFIGFEGNVTGAAAASTHIVFELRFSPGDQVVSEVRFNPNAPNSAGRYIENITDATIIAEQNMIFLDGSWLPAGARLSADRREVYLPGGLNPSVDTFWLLVQEDSGGAAITVSPSWAIGILLAASACLRWRRR